MLSRIVDRKVVFVSQIEIALEIALKAYKGNTDKAGQPYILHPLRVMAKMPDEASKAAAVLHDVLEDSDMTADDLRKAGVSEAVVWAVICLTRKKGETYSDFIDRIRPEPVASLIKLADIEDNLNVLRLHELGEQDLRRVAKYHRAWHRLHEVPLGQADGHHGGE